MSHTTFEDIAAQVEIQEGAIVSKVVFRDDALNVTVFGFDTGQDMSEHRSPRHAIIEILSGRMEIIVENHTHDAVPGFWLHIEPDIAHSLVAAEPTVMLLTLV